MQILYDELYGYAILLLFFSLDISVNNREKEKYMRRLLARQIRKETRLTVLVWTTFWFQEYWCDISLNSPEVVLGQPTKADCG